MFVASRRRTRFRRGRVLVLAVGALLTLGGGSSLAAQVTVDPTSCGHFESWQAAQAALDDPNTPNREHLDPDEDGIACESAFGVGDGDIPADQMSCSNFDNQEAAQAHYDASNAGQREILDPDGDGMACEDAFGVVVDPVSCGHFERQEDAQAALDDPNRPNRENLDGDGDGIACEDRFGEPGQEDSNAEVTSLPSTGTGPSGGPEVQVVIGALLLAAVSAAGWLTATLRR